MEYAYQIFFNENPQKWLAKGPVLAKFELFIYAGFPHGAGATVKTATLNPFPSGSDSRTTNE